VREEASLIDQSLINEIAVAFPLDPIPLADDITRCTYDKKNGGSFGGPCSDCVKIAEFFASKQWDEPTPLEYRRFCDATSLMTQNAFNYYLPGWMTASVADHRSADVLPDHLISTMSGRSEFSAARIEKCYECLSESQLLCIKRFIVWYHGDEDWDDKDVDFALERLHSRLAREQKNT
jgi:hypothetical protein